jgi:hypothetical protein
MACSGCCSAAPDASDRALRLLPCDRAEYAEAAGLDGRRVRAEPTEGLERRPAHVRDESGAALAARARASAAGIGGGIFAVGTPAAFALCGLEFDGGASARAGAWKGFLLDTIVALECTQLRALSGRTLLGRDGELLRAGLAEEGRDGSRSG